MKKFWSLLKGNKTIILSILWGCLEAGAFPLTGPWLTIARVTIATLGAGALYDHRKHFSINQK